MSNLDLNSLRQALKERDIELTTLADETGVLLDLGGHQVLTLNETATFLTDLLLNTSKPEQALAKALCARYDINAAAARQDISELLDDLAGLLEIKPPDPQTKNES